MNDEKRQESFYIQEKLFDENTSQLNKYQDLIIGQRGFWKLVRYELILLLSSWVPGALGLFLRSKLYPFLLGACGKGVVFGCNVVLRHPHKIRLGDNIIIDDNCVLDAKGDKNAGIDIADGVFVGRNSILYTKDGDIVLGRNVNISFNCEIFSGKRVAVGENVQIAAYTYLNGGDHSFDRTDIPIMHQARSGTGLFVEDGAWIAAGVMVFDGVTIGHDAIVGAGSVVTADVPPFAIAAGTPAKVIRMRDEPETPAGDDGQEQAKDNSGN